MKKMLRVLVFCAICLLCATQFTPMLQAHPAVESNEVPRRVLAQVLVAAAAYFQVSPLHLVQKHACGECTVTPLADDAFFVSYNGGGTVISILTDV